MKGLFLTIDKLLRGEFTSREDLRQGRVTIRVGSLTGIGLVLGAIYGIFMGLYSVLKPLEPEETIQFWQLLATTAKVPLLFLLTLVVTFPSLYVFSTLAGSRLRFVETLRLLLAGVAVNLALLASFGPVTGFFTLSTDSYPFMKVLNVIFFTVGGGAGLVFMYKALETVMAPEWLVPEPPSPEPEAKAEAKAKPPSRTLRPDPGHTRLIFGAWMVIYGAVGAQMGWILRPFIGSPDMEFDVFRERESHFFEAFAKALQQLFG